MLSMTRNRPSNRHASSSDRFATGTATSHAVCGHALGRRTVRTLERRRLLAGAARAGGRPQLGAGRRAHKAGRSSAGGLRERAGGRGRARRARSALRDRLPGLYSLATGLRTYVYQGTSR